MSDFYDSLEDDDDKHSHDSSDGKKELIAKSIGETLQSEVANCQESFFLNEKITEKQQNLFSNIQSKHSFRSNARKESNFLPKTESAEAVVVGVETLPLNTSIDEEKLNEQGLQLNSDGSFTKSPRLENLPFVTREYRNLQLQKKKTYQLKIRPSLSKKNKKNIVTYREILGNKVRMSGVVSAREEKSESLLTGVGSPSSFPGNISNLQKNLSQKDNLTDSMKEMLLQKHNRGISGRTSTVSEHLKKTRRVMNLLELGKIFKPEVFPKNAVQGHQKFSNKKGTKNASSVFRVNDKNNSQIQACLANKERQCNALDGKLQKVKITNAKIMKHQSDILINRVNSRLSYLERRQKESGFNPLYLRLGVKKVTSETNRSTFGDSTVDKLSEVSSRVLCMEDADDEDEEMFYRKIMEMDAVQQYHKSICKPEAPFKSKRMRDLSDTSDNKKGLKCKKNSKNKLFPKLISVNMSEEVKLPEHQFKKNSHYCCGNASTLTKNELVMKAKAYGFIANARNILKLKNQTENRLTAESAENGQKVLEKGESKAKKFTNHQNVGDKPLGKRNLLPEINTPKQYKARSPQLLLPLLKSNESLSKPEKYSFLLEKQVGLTLPYVDSGENNQKELKSEILKEIRSCLDLAKMLRFREPM